jgi:lysozyme family protein
MGIYQSSNPDLPMWDIITEELKRQGNNLAKASRVLYSNKELAKQVEDVYKARYWDKARLDDVNSQHIANEMFIFGVNAGMKTSIKKAQKIVKVTVDGKIGNNTINALNKFEESKFDLEFDEEERKYYASIIKRKPSFGRFKRNWMRRAGVV